MKRSAIFAAVGLALVLALSGCGGNKNDQSQTEAETGAQEADLGSVTKLGPYIGVKLTKESSEVTDEELEATIQSILDANTDYTEVSRAAQDGDRVNIDYVGIMDGEEFDGGSAEDYYLTLGSGSFIDGFEDGLIGAKAGEERALELTFPETYYEDLAGKDVTFNVTVNSVEEPVEAVLDDDFVQSISEFSTVDEFTQDLIDMIEGYKETAVEASLQREALQAVVDSSTFDLNQDSLEENLQYNISYMEYMASMYGMTLEDFAAYGYGMSLDEMEDYLIESIEDQMKQTLIVNAIQEKENLTVTDEDLQYAADMLYSDLDDLMESDPEYLQANAIAYKVANLIIDNAEITEEAPAAAEDAEDTDDTKDEDTDE